MRSIRRVPLGAALLTLAVFASNGLLAQPATDLQAARLIAALLGETPLEEDLRELATEIGGRATGTPANLASVDWALGRFRDAGVSAAKEAFTMPELWLERSASARITGTGDPAVAFEARAAAMPFSTAAPAPGATAPLLDGGKGTASDFERLGEEAAGAFVLIETDPLVDIEGLFKEYNEAYDIERRAVAASAAIVYMSSRAEGLLYRHNSSLRGEEARPMLILDRGAARRALDLLRGGTPLSLTAVLDLEIGPSYESYNVIGEIKGSTAPDEVVVVGAHLDSWDLGDGALDNGANVALVIDVARQMRRLGIQPRRTVRFALWNGEEQGLLGSRAYVKRHAGELDRHVAAMSFDIGCGAINGFFTGGRPEFASALDGVLEVVRGLGPFQIIDAPVVGTDNYDFMMEGIANLVGNHEPATYGLNYHAQSDRFEQCDLRALRLNAAVVAAVTYGLATADVSWTRQSPEEIQALIDSTDLERQMRVFNVWDAWVDGTRGRRTD